MIGFYLAAFRKVILPLLSLEVILKDDEGWGEEIMINKAYRRKGLASILKDRVYRELRNRGIKYLYGNIRSNNKDSLNSAAKLRIQKAFYVRLLKNINSNKLIFSEISADSYRKNSTEKADRLALKPYNIIKKTIADEPDSVIEIPKENGSYLFTIKISDFF